MQHAAVDARAGFERLYREEGDRLWSAVLAYAGDRDVASDAVAEAFAQAIRRGDAIRQPIAWIWRAAFRIAAGELKRRRDHSSRVPERSYEMDDVGGSILQAVATLSERQRAAVALHYYADRSLKDTARIMGTSAAAVGVHLHRARRRLRDILGDDVD